MTVVSLFWDTNMARPDIMLKHSKEDITDCLQTLFLLALKFFFSEKKNLFKKANAPLVGTLISTGDVSGSIAIQYNSSIILKGHFLV